MRFERVKLSDVAYKEVGLGIVYAPFLSPNLSFPPISSAPSYYFLPLSVSHLPSVRYYCTIQ
jgi:hypothetical protein